LHLSKVQQTHSQHVTTMMLMMIKPFTTNGKFIHAKHFNNTSNQISYCIHSILFYSHICINLWSVHYLFLKTLVGLASFFFFAHGAVHAVYEIEECLM